MKIIDILLILALGAVIVLAVRRTLRARKSGGCGCGCPGCTGQCPSGMKRQ